jgi:hypothetical protein
LTSLQNIQTGRDEADGALPEEAREHPLPIRFAYQERRSWWHDGVQPFGDDALVGKMMEGAAEIDAFVGLGWLELLKGDCREPGARELGLCLRHHERRDIDSTQLALRNSPMSECREHCARAAAYFEDASSSFLPGGLNQVGDSFFV